MTTDFKQQPHKLLVIPGPIEFSDSVLGANAAPGMSHVSPAFIPVFGDCIRMLRKVLYAPKGQPMLIAGSGTLGWDAAAVNLVEPGENVLVLNHGYFADSFADCLRAYGANVDELKAKVGGIVDPKDLEQALQKKKYKLVTITQVDTSTGVLAPVKQYSEIIHKTSPNSLIAVDAVCAVASEEIRFDDWGLDVVISATQKGLGVPPGLSVCMLSERAIKTMEARDSIPSYYLSWKRWLPIMKAYEEGRPMYFATPPVQLIYSLRQGLKEILEGDLSFEDRLARNREVSNRVKDELEKLGCGFVPLSRDIAANGMSAVRYPAGVTAADVIPKLAERDIVVAGGLHKDIASEYFRVGHMGVTSADPSRGDVDKIINGVKAVLDEAKKNKA